MSEKAKQRIEALGKQLAPVRKVAGASNGPRLHGKVAIVTGELLASPQPTLFIEC